LDLLFLRSQIGTLDNSFTSLPFSLNSEVLCMLLPFAFTEQGVAMLSGVLTSKQAIIVNIQIMGTFTEMRQMLFDNTELRLYIEKIKKKTENNTRNIEVVFRYLDELIDKKERPKKRPIVGFKTRNRKIK
jgi:hypothetical protein